MGPSWSEGAEALRGLLAEALRGLFTTGSAPDALGKERKAQGFVRGRLDSPRSFAAAAMQRRLLEDIFKKPSADLNS